MSHVCACALCMFEFEADLNAYSVLIPAVLICAYLLNAGAYPLFTIYTKDPKQGVQYMYILF